MQVSSFKCSFKFSLLQNVLWPNGQITHNLHDIIFVEKVY